MAVRLFVGNMPYGATEADLRSHFTAVAPPSQIVVPVDRDTGRPRGFAFVTFATEEEAKVAAEKMNGLDLDGRQLTVNEAKPKTEMGGGAGGGGRNYGSPNRSPGAFQARGNSRY